MKVQEMYDEINIDSSIWLRYSFEKKQCSTNIFCFFEGEDRKYYLKRVANITKKSLKEINTYDCEGRDSVVIIKNKICEKGNKILNHLFFIDHDYSLKSVGQNTNNLFITSGYSIENYYVTLSTLKGILQVEFGLNSNSNAFIEITEKFKCELNVFETNAQILGFWTYSLQHFGMKIDVHAFKFEDFFEIKSQNLVVKTELNFKNIYMYYTNEKRKYVKRFDKAFFEKKKDNIINLFNELNNSSEITQTFCRGKFEIEFLKLFLKGRS